MRKLRYSTVKAALGLMILPEIALGFSSVNKPETERESPNVIFILADDLGYGDLGCYGQKLISTPQIDKLADEGILFTDMYAGSSVCSPSRAVLLSGKHTGYSSIRSNRQDQLMGDDEFTIAKLFKNAGYATGGIGKWGVGHPPPLNDPQKKGFDYFYGYIDMFHAHNYFPEYLYENGRKVILSNKLLRINGENPWKDDRGEGMGVAESKNEYSHDLFDAKAIEFIEKNVDNKFFLYMSYTVPHSNNEGEYYNGDGMEVPVAGYYEFRDTKWPTAERGFAAMIRKIDNSVGIIKEKLKELNIDKETLIIFTSDNGPHQSGGHYVDFFKSNGEFRGKKTDLYEGGIRVPFIASWPGVIAKGTRHNEPQAFWDFMPTFAELTGEKKPENTNGISFYPALIGKNQTEKHDFLYWEYYTRDFDKNGGIQAIRKGDWKILKFNINAPGKEEIFELYNLAVDPGEKNNLAGQHPGLVREFNELFITSRTEFPILPLYE